MASATAYDLVLGAGGEQLFVSGVRRIPAVRTGARLVRFSARRVMMTLAVMAFVVPALGVAASPAPADAISDKRAEAAQIAQKLDQLGTQIDQLGQQYDAAQQQLGTVNVRDHRRGQAGGRVHPRAGRGPQAAGRLRRAGLRAGRRERVARHPAHRQRQRRRAPARVPEGRVGQPRRPHRPGAGRPVRHQRQAGHAGCGPQLGPVPPGQADQREEPGHRGHGPAAGAAGHRHRPAGRSGGPGPGRPGRGRRSRGQGPDGPAAVTPDHRRPQATRLARRTTPTTTGGHPGSPPTTTPSPTTTDPGGSGSGGPVVPIYVPPGTPPPVLPGAATAIAVARRYLGTPYQWGGASPATGFDCSGLVQYSFGQAGISLPRVADAQAAATRHVTYAQAQAGRPGLLRLARHRPRGHLPGERDDDRRPPHRCGHPDREHLVADVGGLRSGRLTDLLGPSVGKPPCGRFAIWVSSVKRLRPGGLRLRGPGPARSRRGGPPPGP